jgi:hypothetical protein
MRSERPDPSAGRPTRSRSGVAPDVLAAVRARRATRRRGRGGDDRGDDNRCDDEARPGGGDTPLASVIAGFLREHRIGSRDPLLALAPLLAEIAGPRVAPRLRPVRLRGRELCVYVDSASLLHELQSFTGRTLEQRFAAACRERKLTPVERLVFRHTH